MQVFVKKKASHASEKADIRYRRDLDKLKEQFNRTTGSLRLAKTKPSNLFRYQGSDEKTKPNLDLSPFSHIHGLDVEKKFLTVEGLTTYEQIVDYCLPQGYLPTVTPELMHMTVGGALSGVGIESSGFRHGFVHDGLVEADVLLFTGDVVTCRADNAYADLFHALPNSYGTLGYILKATIRVAKARPYIKIASQEFSDVDRYLESMRRSCGDPNVDFIEGLFYNSKRFYLILGKYQEEGKNPADIFRSQPYYQQVSKPNHFCLKAKDYIFRYEPDWFWNVPTGQPYQLFRWIAPISLRKSQYYQRYIQWKERFLKEGDQQTAPVIQDWEVPWEKGAELIHYALEHVDLEGRPWAAVPILPQTSPTLYPVEAQRLYFNLGSYCRVNRKLEKVEHAYSKGIDAFCFSLGGIKMLYSSTFLSEDAFNAIYSGEQYRQLKQKYDPDCRARTLYQKSVIADLIK